MASITSKVITGNFSVGSNWVGEVAPVDGDTAIIVSGSIITFDEDHSAYATGIIVTIDAGGELYISRTATTVLKLLDAVNALYIAGTFDAGSVGDEIPAAYSFRCISAPTVLRNPLIYVYAGSTFSARGHSDWFGGLRETTMNTQLAPSTDNMYVNGDASSWKVGAKVSIVRTSYTSYVTSTSYYSAQLTNLMEIASVGTYDSGNDRTLITFTAISTFVYEIGDLVVMMSRNVSFEMTNKSYSNYNATNNFGNFNLWGNASTTPDFDAYDVWFHGINQMGPLGSGSNTNAGKDNYFTYCTWTNCRYIMYYLGREYHMQDCWAAGCYYMNLIGGQGFKAVRVKVWGFYQAIRTAYHSYFEECEVYISYVGFTSNHACTYKNCKAQSCYYGLSSNNDVIGDFEVNYCFRNVTGLQRGSLGLKMLGSGTPFYQPNSTDVKINIPNSSEFGWLGYLGYGGRVEGFTNSAGSKLLGISDATYSTTHDYHMNYNNFNYSGNFKQVNLHGTYISALTLVSGDTDFQTPPSSAAFVVQIDPSGINHMALHTLFRNYPMVYYNETIGSSVTFTFKIYTANLDTVTVTEDRFLLRARYPIDSNNVYGVAESGAISWSDAAGQWRSISVTLTPEHVGPIEFDFWCALYDINGELYLIDPIFTVT